MSWNVSPNNDFIFLSREIIYGRWKKIWNIPLWPRVVIDIFGWLSICQEPSENFHANRTWSIWADDDIECHACWNASEKECRLHSTSESTFRILSLSYSPIYSHNYVGEGSMKAPEVSTWRLIAEWRAFLIKSIQLFEHLRRQREFGLPKNGGSGGEKSFWRSHLNSTSTAECSASLRTEQRTIWFGKFRTFILKLFSDFDWFKRQICKSFHLSMSVFDLHKFKKDCCLTAKALQITLECFTVISLIFHQLARMNLERV